MRARYHFICLRYSFVVVICFICILHVILRNLRDLNSPVEFSVQVNVFIYLKSTVGLFTAVFSFGIAAIRKCPTKLTDEEKILSTFGIQLNTFFSSYVFFI